MLMIMTNNCKFGITSLDVVLTSWVLTLLLFVLIDVRMNKESSCCSEMQRFAIALGVYVVSESETDISNQVIMSFISNRELPFWNCADRASIWTSSTVCLVRQDRQSETATAAKTTWIFMRSFAILVRILSIGKAIACFTIRVRDEAATEFHDGHGLQDGTDGSLIGEL